MIYNLSKESEVKDLQQHLGQLKAKGAIVEVIKKSGTRTINQNKYLHLLLSYVSLEIGEETSYFKEFIWKREICPRIFRTEYVNPKTKVVREDWRSSADLSVDELTLAIEKLKQFAAKELGIELPEASNTTALYQISNTIEKNQIYL